MKFIISENRINDLVIKHLDSMFDVNNIGWTPGMVRTLCLDGTVKSIGMMKNQIYLKTDTNTTVEY